MEEVIRNFAQKNVKTIIIPTSEELQNKPLDKLIQYFIETGAYFSKY